MASGVPAAGVTRLGLVTLGAVIALATLGIVVARAFGGSGSRASALFTVASQWLGAWVVWSFAGSLALQAGLIHVYEPAIFAAVALAGAWWQYRTLVTGARDRALAIFVGGQLAWLVFVMVQNGVLTP
jgi:hypothetical protein